MSLINSNILVLLIMSGIVLGHEWKYNQEDHWPPLCQDGKTQSPIALSRGIAQEKEYTSFILDKYDSLSAAILKNNGHSAEVRLQIDRDSAPEIKGGNLPNVYKLDHLHFHWQSEHTIDAYRFPLELHLVHYAVQHENLTMALKNRNGVAVFAVLFDLSPDDDIYLRPLFTIINSIKDEVNMNKELKINPHDFIPRNIAGYFRYDGSLTTPGCTEGILWTVFTNTIPISKAQVKLFEEIRTNDKTALKKNYRSLQSLNGRKVFLKVSPIRNTAGRTELSVFTLLVTGAVLYLFNL